MYTCKCGKRKDIFDHGCLRGNILSTKIKRSVMKVPLCETLNKWFTTIDKSICVVCFIVLAVSEVLCCYLPPTKSGSACDALQKYLVDRKDWSGEDPSTPMECMWSPVAYVIVHHTVTGACNTEESCAESMRKLQKEHKTEKSWPDVGYHFVIGGNGKVYVGRPWNKIGGHTKNHNRKSIGIALLGNYQNEKPNNDMLELVPKIAYCGVEKGYIHPNFLVIGHRDAYCSTCPGDALYEVVKKWSRFPNLLPIPSYTCTVKTSTIETTEAESTTASATTIAAITTTTLEPTESTTTKSIEQVLPVYFYLLLSKSPIPRRIK